MIRTFVDSGVLIAAARGTDEIARRAMEVLDDPNREFVSSSLVRLETLPKAKYYQQEAEAEFYEEFFKAVREMVHVSETLVSQAFTEASGLGLAAMDALHVAAAKASRAAEIVTTEKPTKPIFAAKGIEVRTIQPFTEAGT